MYKTDAFISGCSFTHNTAGAGAGIANQESTSTTIETSNFISNTAIRHAGALEFYKDHPKVIGCVFIDNKAGSFAGAVLFWFSDSVIYGGIASKESMEACNCNDVSTNYYHHDNESYNYSVHSQFQNYENCTLFISNSARTAGALYAIKSSESLKSFGCAVFSNNNSTLSSMVQLLDSNGTFEGWTEMSRNIGSFFAFYSNITFNMFAKCSTPTHSTANFKEGGSFSLVQSVLYLHGETKFEGNVAEFGGAILATESDIFLNDAVILKANFASQTGGALYLYQSQLYSEKGSTVTIVNNAAQKMGGATHVYSIWV